MAVGFFFFQFPGIPKVRCAFQHPSGDEDDISFVTGSPAAVRAARQDMLEILRPMGMAAWSECRQVHGQEIIAEPKSTPIDEKPELLPPADGMMSCRPWNALMIKTADCQPLLLAHRSGARIMALHVGWRANRFNFPAIAVESFCRHYHIQPCDIFAVRGPSLGPASAEFVNFASEWGQPYQKWHDKNSGCMNLWALTRDQLTGAGVPPDQIYGMDICTAENSGDFFSYRRNRLCGRQASLIWIS